MTLKRRIGFEVLGGMLLVLVASQAVQFFNSRQATAKLSTASETILKDRELQNIRGTHAALNWGMSEALARGDMDVFERLIGLEKHVEGFSEFSLYDQKGTAVFSSDKSALRRKLDPALQSKLFSTDQELIQNNGSSIEIYRPVIASSKCLECHDNFKAGATCGVTYCRFSNNAAARLSRQFGEVNAASQKQWQAWSLGILLVGGLMAIGITMVIARPIVRTLGAAAGQLDNHSSEILSASSQVSSSSQKLAEGASNQAASIEETRASLEQLASMTQRNAENARKAHEFARQSREAADLGAADMRRMNEAISAIKESSDDIAKIIKTIDELAFQTNILALNAAVEAARAGEAGMGFAVVADEVRNLAQRSADAAKETSAKIEGAICRTSQGVEFSGKVSKVLSEIVTKARQVDELITEVSAASEEQSNGIKQINAAVGQMDNVTQGNAASAEEGAAAAEELNSNAISMRSSVADLARLIGETAAESQDMVPNSIEPRKNAKMARAASVKRFSNNKTQLTNVGS